MSVIDLKSANAGQIGERLVNIPVKLYRKPAEIFEANINPIFVHGFLYNRPTV